MRIVIELKKDSNAEIIISNLAKINSPNQLWCNIFSLIKGKLAQLNLKQYLNFFLSFRGNN